MTKYVKLIIGVAVVIAVIFVLFWVKSCVKDNYLELGTNDTIDPTPTQIQSIRAIGEWEFLSVSAEEMVDTVRKGFFSDDELVRIYYGTLRIGIDTRQLKEGWLKTEGDSILVTLPDVQLLDRHFIDEARTKSFYERGRWSPEDREALYRKAMRLMIKRCMTPENLSAARQNGEAQLLRLLRGLGFERVRITWQPPKQKTTA